VTFQRSVVRLGAAALLAACASSHPTNARYPALPEGCPVRVFEEAPGVPTENLGTVRERCATDVSREDCLRGLKDQACRLGADVVWGVADAPRVIGDKNEWDGRAAHTK
jgi:hypothetical protein